jgi:CheY-like chemotaxis protein
MDSRTPAPGPTPPLRILVVEDHADSADMLRRMLAADRHGVSAVATGIDAIAAIAREAFDVVICDLGLPDVSGIDVMAVVRERPGLHGILLSGTGDADAVARARAAGFRCCLPKPVDLAALRRELADLTRR